MAHPYTYIHTFARPRYRLEEDTKLDLEETGSENVDWIRLVQGRKWLALANTVRNHQFPQKTENLLTS
jgi:hypothetical protein